MKKCTICLMELPLSRFTNDISKKDGKRPDCKECFRIRRNSHYHKNKEIIAEKRRTPEYRKKNAESKRKYNKRHPEQYLLDKARERAKNIGVSFSLTTDDIFIPNRCPILNIELRPGNGKLHDCSPTIDRIVPSLGYTKDNIAVISWKANKIKSNGTLSELKQIVSWLERQI